MQSYQDPLGRAVEPDETAVERQRDLYRHQTTATTSRPRTEMIQETYRLLAVGVFCAMGAAWLASRTPALIHVLATVPGLIICLLAINFVPHIARRMLGANPRMGIIVLALDGLLSGLALSPLVYVALRMSGLGEQSPNLVQAALVITAFAFLGVTAYVHKSGVNFQWGGGLFAGLFCTALGLVAVSLIFPGATAFSYLLLGIVGVLGVLQILYGTSKVLNEPEFRDPVSGALILFAGLFNLFQVVLSLLLGGRSRD